MDETGKYLLVDKIYLKTLVYRLENEQWLKLENEKITERLKVFERLTAALKDETRLQTKLIEGHRETLTVLQMQKESAQQRITQLKVDIGEYKSALDASKGLSVFWEKENSILRRRLAGQTLFTWAVSAAGGAIIIFLLL
ncbi:MAG: hypothetical protein V3S46_00540 [Nitrospinota bacterium]